MDFEIRGLDRLKRRLEALGQSAEASVSAIKSIKFDPADAKSVEQAVVRVSSIVDENFSTFQGDGEVQHIAEEIKQKAITQIREQAG